MTKQLLHVYSYIVTRPGRGKTASKPYYHPNEMMDDYEMIGHLPKLMALWLTTFFERPTNKGKLP